MNRLTYSELQSLFNRYDGPIPEQAILDTIAMRGHAATPHVATAQDLQGAIWLCKKMAAQSRRNASINRGAHAESLIADAEREEALAIEYTHQLEAITGHQLAAE